MKKLSGLVLDYYDDVDGVVFQKLSSAAPVLSGLEKTAASLDPEALSRLPDDVFALLLQDGDTSLRKYAMADAGNTALSIAYFLELGHRLPVEAQKVAAANLIQGCEWYGFQPPPELEKIALGLGTAIHGALVLPGAMSEAKKNLQAVKGAPGIMTPEQIKARRMQMGV
jgi:hypothetical protein